MNPTFGIERNGCSRNLLSLARSRDEAGTGDGRLRGEGDARLGESVWVAQLTMPGDSADLFEQRAQAEGVASGSAEACLCV